MTAALIAIGVTALVPGAIWYQVAFMAIWSFAYQATIGSVAWPISTEVVTSSLRSHTQSLATVTNGLAGAVTGVMLPFAMNPDQWNLGGKIAFVYGGALAVATVGIWVWWPETKGRSFGDMDRLFERGTKTRHFGKVVLEPIDEVGNEDGKV